jgi:hypothetical protein
VMALALWQLVVATQKNTYLSQQLSSLQLDAVISKESARREQETSYLPTFDQKEIGMVTTSVIRDYEKVDNGDGTITWWLLRADEREDFDSTWYLEKITESPWSVEATRSSIMQRKAKMSILPDRYTSLRIDSVLPASGDVLISVSGGDGCGGKGAFWTSDGIAFKKIVQVGYGCVLGAEETLAGGVHLDNFIYAGEVIPTEAGVSAIRTAKLWKYDPETAKRTVVATLADLPPGVLYPAKSKHPDFDLVFEFYQGEIPGESDVLEFYGYDLETKRYEKLDRNQALE